MSKNHKDIIINIMIKDLSIVKKKNQRNQRKMRKRRKRRNRRN